MFTEKEDGEVELKASCKKYEKAEESGIGLIKKGKPDDELGVENRK